MEVRTSCDKDSQTSQSILVSTYTREKNVHQLVNVSVLCKVGFSGFIRFFLFKQAPSAALKIELESCETEPEQQSSK